MLPAAIGLLVLLLPIAALLVRASWSSLPARMTGPDVGAALRLSVLSAALSTLLCLLLGVPLAWVLARTSFRGRAAVRALVSVPMVLPPVVGGVALLLLLGRRGLLGQHLHAALGITLPFTTAAVVVAQTFVALPYLVISVDGALHAADLRYEEAAATLGASRWYVFRRVTLPAAAPGITSGAVLCFARALGEFGATITFAGSFPGITRTMPTAVYLAIEHDPEAAIALSLLLLAMSVLVLACLRERWAPGGAR